MKKVFIIITPLLFFLILHLPASADGRTQLKIKTSSGTTVNNTASAVSGAFVEYNEFENNETQRLYLIINTNNIPKNISIEKAELNLVIKSCTGITANISLSRVASTWDPSSLTWANKPGFTSPTASTDLDCINQLAKWDVKDLINGFLNGIYTNNGIVIYGPDESGTAPYYREFNLNDENSFLDIVYTVEDNQPQETSYVSKKKIILYIALVLSAAGFGISAGFLIKLTLDATKQQKKSIAIVSKPQVPISDQKPIQPEAQQQISEPSAVNKLIQRAKNSIKKKDVEKNQKTPE